MRYARKLARESQPVVGTLAERYLREHRQINLRKFPSSLRFHSGIYSKCNEGIYPALLVVAKDAGDKVKAVQAIFLADKTAQKANLAVKKQTWGIPSQCAAMLGKAVTAAANKPTYLAEGVETALSIYAALGGGDVRVTLGKSNFKNVDAKVTGKHVVLCLDNDGNQPEGDKLINAAAQSLLAQGKQVWLAKPKEAGQDYNDVLKNQGLEAVKKEIYAAVSYDDYQAQKTLTVTLKSAVLDNGHLSLTNLKLLEQEAKCQLQKDSIKAFIATKYAKPTPPLLAEGFTVPLQGLGKTAEKSTFKTVLPSVNARETATFSMPDNEPKPLEKTEKDREPEF